jgi:chromosome partitioning protein
VSSRHACGPYKLQHVGPTRESSTTGRFHGIDVLVLVPIRPQIFDLETLSAVRDALRIAGSPPSYVVLNGIHPTATRSPAEQRDMIGSAFMLPVCPVHLSHRAAFAEAPATGKAPQELEPQGKAAAELEALFAFVQDAATQAKMEPAAKEAR